MKLLQKFTKGLIFAISVTILWGIANTPHAFAAPAVCYLDDRGTYTSDDCGEDSIVGDTLRLYGLPIEEDKCYTAIVDYSSTLGPPSPPQKYDLASERCTELAGQTQQTSTLPFRCWQISLSEAEYQSYDNLDRRNQFDEYSETQCDDPFKGVFSANRPGFSFNNGWCYVKSNDNKPVRELPCTELFQGWILSEKVDQMALNSSIESPDRKANIQCSNPDGMTKEECTAELLEKNSLMSLLKRAVQFMTVVVGVVITAVIVWAGVEYSSAGGDPNKTAGAKNRIRNAIIALVVYIFLGAGLNWLVPGGLF